MPEFGTSGRRGTGPGGSPGAASSPPPDVPSPDVPSLGGRLDAIRATASGDGVTVTVDLHGKPVGLEFAREAFTRTPSALAETVRRLADEAAADALARGLAVVTEVVPAGLLDSGSRPGHGSAPPVGSHP
ncbi:hypothetical protein AB0I60_23840 [Actinosynnema sp. NPDC050436]|uniref:hypothetical protein n=1 Tax=Actinosynnema sp. NPDC050436 TaxID=3155659 RepID=UPI00340AF160